MESSQRGALGLVRLIACCLIVLGVLDAGLYFTEYLHVFSSSGHKEPSQPLNILRIILDSLPIIAGIVVFIKSRAIAEWLSELIE
ncbi:MAG TPA: hypothetical protein VMH87_03610 [Pseudomonadales bacterium]|nr:hypothetical protein [Pseudomonadales bacterium]